MRLATCDLRPVASEPRPKICNLRPATWDLGHETCGLELDQSWRNGRYHRFLVRASKRGCHGATSRASEYRAFAARALFFGDCFGRDEMANARTRAESQRPAWRFAVVRARRIVLRQSAAEQCWRRRSPRVRLGARDESRRSR